MKQSFVALLLAAAMLALAILPLRVQAQSGCTGDPCVWDTPTATATNPATPVPGEGTPTAVPLPQSTGFPKYNYGIPTPIATFEFPDAPPEFNPSPPALPSPVRVINRATPAPISFTTWLSPSVINPAPITFSTVATTTGLTAPEVLSFTVAASSTVVPLHDISTTIPISYTALVTDLGSVSETGMIRGWLSGVLTDVISYTNYLTSTVVDSSEVITVINAPDWYVPDLPRPLADIGWTFEQITGPDEAAPSYSIDSWAAFVGYMSSMPFQLVKALWIFGTALGPVGLFLAWLIAVFNVVVFMKLLQIVAHVIMTIIDVILRIFWA